MKKIIAIATLVLAGAVTASAANSFVYTSGLIKMGSRGAQVYELQRCLHDLGVNSSSNIDGIYGSRTKAAVMAFQAKKGVAVDGIIGPVTGPLYTAACAKANEGGESTVDKTEMNEHDGIEGDIEKIKVKKGDDTKLVSDKKGQELFEIEVEVEEDGSDVQIERMDLEFEVSGETTRNYKLINKVDIDGFGSKSTDDKDDWRSDNKVVRINGEKVVKAGKKETFVVELDIDEIDTNNTKVILKKVNVRYTDGAGISKTKEETVTVTVNFSEDSKFGFKSFEVDDDQEEKMSVDVSSDTDKTEIALYNVEVKKDVKEGVLETLTVKVDGVTDDSEDGIKTLYAKVDGKEFEADVKSDGSFEFDLDDMKVDAEDEFDVEIMADFAEVDEDGFASKTYFVTELAFAGESDDEDIAGDQLDSMKIDGVAAKGTVVKTSQGDVTYKVSNIKKYKSVIDDEKSSIKFDVKITNDSGDELAIEAALANWKWDIEGVAGAEGADLTVKSAVLESDANVAAGTAPADKIADGKSKEFTVIMEYSQESDDKLSVEVEEIGDFVLVKA